MANENKSHLIIVPGHGVCTNPTAAQSDDSWVGIFPGEGKFYIEHAERGVRLAASQMDALLVFSGGQTREDAKNRSEAESYWEIAESAQWWGFSTSVRNRVLMEEYARDSFENLLYGIALFRQQAGIWPEMVTVCGWEFKQKRYSLHRQALKWSKQKFTYVGVNNPLAGDLPKALAGEKAKVESVSRDLFLVGAEWVAQRELRNPFHRKHPYRGIDPNLDVFFDFLDSNTFTDKLPWV